jgi:uncharacterized membrane protein
MTRTVQGPITGPVPKPATSVVPKPAVRKVQGPAYEPKLPRWVREITWRTAVAGALLGGVIHILATFAVPLVGSSTAYYQLRDSLPLNRMVVLPAPAPGKQLLPYLPPDNLYAMCRYELTGGPVTVTAEVADKAWVLSLHTPRSDNFYVLPGEQLRRSEVSFLLVPSGDRILSEAVLAQRRASGAADTQIPSPSLEGLIVLRAPLRGLAWQAQTEAILRRSSCTQVQR